MTIVNTYPTKREWLIARQNGIGGSEAAALLGCQPYMTNIDLWLNKTTDQIRDHMNTDAQTYGIKAEPLLIDLFRLDYPIYDVFTTPPSHDNATPFVLQANKDYPFILGTVDAGLYEIGECKRRGFLEVKTAQIFSSLEMEKWNNRIPQHYYCQILHYFLVNSDYEFCMLKAQLKFGSCGNYDNFSQPKITTRHYYFERRNLTDDLKYLEKKEIEFWKNVENKIKPDLVLPPI